MPCNAETPQFLLLSNLLIGTKHVNPRAHSLRNLVMLKITIPGLLQAQHIGKTAAWVDRTAKNLRKKADLVGALNPIADVTIQCIFRKHPQHANRRSDDEVHPP